MADREPFPPVPRMPSYPASGLLGLGLIGAMVVAAVSWGWWAPPLVFIAFIVLVVFLRELRLWLGWKWHRRSRDPALADVNSWLYRDDADHLVGELVTNERMLIALPARDIESLGSVSAHHWSRSWWAGRTAARDPSRYRSRAVRLPHFCARGPRLGLPGPDPCASRRPRSGRAAA